MEELVKDMKPKFIEDLGMRYPTEKSGRKHRYGLYECQYCGKEFEGSVYSVKRGQTKSCGCLRGEAHGLTNNQFYDTWKSMMGRCVNVNIKQYNYYGGRGITVCEEWLDVRNFVAWCDLTHPNIEGLSLDRIDNDKGYSPDNCRWADRTAQSVNQRIMKNNTSGYVGVIWNIRNKRWTAYISVNNTKKHIGSFKTIEEAVLARDQYISKNKLPHKLSTQY